MKKYLYLSRILLILIMLMPNTQLHTRVEIPSIDTNKDQKLTTDQLITQLIIDEDRKNPTKKNNDKPTSGAPLRDDKPMDEKGNSRLHWLARVGDASELEKALNQATHENWLEKALDAQNNNGLSPLHTAAMYGQGSAAQILTKFGFSMEAQDNWGNLPVHYACLFSPEQNTVIYFLEQANNLEAVGEMGLTPLAQLILQNSKYLVDYCISKGARTDYAITLNSVGEFFRIFPHLEQNKHEFILDHQYGLVALSQAVGNYQITASLIEANAPVTKVHMLVEAPSIIQSRPWLEKQKISLNLLLGLPVTDYKGNAPLSRSIKDGQEIQLFLTAGSSVNWLHEKTNASPIHMAVAQNNSQALKDLLALPKANPTVQMWENSVWERQGKTPLMLALSINHPDTEDGNIVDILLADPRVCTNLLARDVYGRTALHIASQNSEKNVAKLLHRAPNEKIQQKMLNATDNGGLNPLTHARLTDSEECAKIAIFLTEQGAQVQTLREEDPTLAINSSSCPKRKPTDKTLTAGEDLSSMPVSGSKSFEETPKQLTSINSKNS